MIKTEEYYTLNEFMYRMDTIDDLNKLLRDQLVYMAYSMDADKQIVFNYFGGYPCRMRKNEIKLKLIHFIVSKGKK